MTVAEWIRLAEARLRQLEVESPRLEAQVLAAHVLRVDRVWLIAHGDEEFPDLAGESLLQRREAYEPLAYILGYRDFYGRTFTVDSSVLIPRHETEILVESALALSGPEPRSVLDLGTGSGILAITLKLERPHWSVTAVDKSPEALATASANARFHGAKIRFLLSDGFSSLLGESFDLIVTNPPYIGFDEELSASVKSHEPAMALFSGPSGLEFYDRLAVEAADYLDRGGLLAMEVGYRQAESVSQLFRDQNWEVRQVVPDLSGIQRVVVVSPNP